MLNVNNLLTLNTYPGGGKIAPQTTLVLTISTLHETNKFPLVTFPSLWLGYKMT